MCVTNRHDMTLDVKAALNPNITNQPTKQPLSVCLVENWLSRDLSIRTVHTKRREYPVG